MNPYQQTEILETLRQGHENIRLHFSTLSESVFLQSTVGKWNPAQHLAHLTLTHSRIAQGLVTKERLPRHSSPSKNYSEIVGIYQQELARESNQPLLANNPFGVQINADTRQSEIISQFEQGNRLLHAGIEAWPDEELDKFAMPHPLLGALSVREILFFCIYHDIHHLNRVRL